VVDKQVNIKKMFDVFKMFFERSAHYWIRILVTSKMMQVDNGNDFFKFPKCPIID